MARVAIHKDDRFKYYVMDEKEVFGTFGEEYLADYGKEIPDYLLERYKKVQEEYDKIQKELYEIYKR